VLTATSVQGGAAYADSFDFTLDTTGVPKTIGGASYADSGNFNLDTTGVPRGVGGASYADSPGFTLDTTGVPRGIGGASYSDSTDFTLDTTGVPRGLGGASYADSADFTVNTLLAGTIVYTGNGDAGFGGAIGTGTLILSNNSTTVFGTFQRGAGSFYDVLVIYLDTGVGGFTTSAGFGDGADGLRRAISGFDGGANRSLLTFSNAAVSFRPAYAIALGPSSDSFGGLWQLANGANYSLNFISSVNLNPIGTALSGNYTFSFTFSQIGVNPVAGASFKLLGTYLSNVGYRSGEALAGNLAGFPGWNPFSATAYGVYSVYVAPPQPALLSGPLYTPGRGFQFNLTGQSGASYVVQAATNAAAGAWTNLITNLAPFIFVDSNASLYPRRFYRALSQP
jgi:hypothetical protein